MQKDKIKSKLWAKQQTKIGQKAVFPIVILSLLSSMIAVGLSWCIAQILGIMLVPTLSLSFDVSVFIIAFVLLSIFRAIFIYSEELFAAKIGLQARHRLRKELVQRIMQIGPSILYKQSSGGLTTLIADHVESLDGYFSRWLPASILWFLSPCIILVFIFFVQPWAALIIGLCGLMVPIAQATFGIGAAVAARQQFVAMTRLQARFLDRIQGIATIVLAGRSEGETEKLAKAANELRKRTMKVLRVAFLSSASIDCAMIVAIVLVAMMDVGQFLNHHDTSSVHVTHALFALLIIPEFFAPLRSLALAYQDKAKLSGTAASVVELPEPVLEIIRENQLDHTQPIQVTFEDVSYRWDEKRGNVLNHLSFDIKARDTALLIGASGAGKSTIISMLLGFIKPNQGRILFNNIDISTISYDSLSSVTAWIGQKPVIFAGTIKENILFAKPTATEDELQSAIKFAAIDQYLSSLPKGLDTFIGEGGFGLSGGQAQRISIARAYLKDAPLLLLDEPTAHLDPLTEQDIFKRLVKLAQNRTVILATHSAAGQQLNGLHLRLEHGRLISQERIG
ncbi:thiol reductant ABC exporter subunit CydD [Commensalibacter oyaizuii]|uniref:Thiol reductant ABC exporter subunit CydD n=1 Tax=Commensalibacter oyaizuii TaxID=3043873 RepID=A0ABT6PZ50_9PROT|nr:thiol reductant ABC exporter subunit CydD [Commensalibacter sp. TBRC 16381]MDI2090135.1 thiol reductant ABC exporter subunit CydD [Commensalibacter sp. TBRC 16381]